MTKWNCITTVLGLSLIPSTVTAGERIAVFPTVPYDQMIIYWTLTIFWIGILGLLVIIRMKLKEIERVQKLNLDEPGGRIPFLD